MSYDQKCYDLAEVFLEDEPGFLKLPTHTRKQLADEMAQDIQDCIESNLEFFRGNHRFKAVTQSAASHADNLEVQPKEK